MVGFRKFVTGAKKAAREEYRSRREKFQRARTIRMAREKDVREARRQAFEKERVRLAKIEGRRRAKIAMQPRAVRYGQSFSGGLDVIFGAKPKKKRKKRRAKRRQTIRVKRGRQTYDIVLR